MDKHKTPPDSFKKAVLYLAFIHISIFTIWQMIVFTITGNEASTLIQWFFTLWGVEVGLLMLKTLLDDRRNAKSQEDDELDESQIPPDEEEVFE